MNKYNKTNIDNNVLAIYPIDEGFVKGNMFKDIYKGYKKYVPKISQPTDEKQMLLLMIQMYCFGAHDINLYLDVYPSNQEALKKYLEFNTRLEEAKKEYEKKYGPLNVSDISKEENIWPWIKESWPWEVNR